MSKKPKKPHISARNLKIIKSAAAMVANTQQQRLSSRGDYSFYSGHYHYSDTAHDKSWTDYGYPDVITFGQLWHMWRRNPVAARVCKLPINYCWLDHPKVIEGDADDKQKKETQYEKNFAKFSKRLKLWSRVKAGDLYQRVGRYSGLIMVVADGQLPSTPLGTVTSDKVIEIKPAFEGQLEVVEVEEDRASPRFQQPMFYQFREIDVGARSRWDKEDINIHWTRVIPIAEDADDGGIYGVPALECIFNSLLDWEKIQGAGGEGLWRAAAQKYVLQAAKDTGSQKPTPEELDGLTDMLVDMFSGFNSMPFLGDMEMTPLDTNMPNPQHYTAHTKDSIAAGSGFAAKILFGSQTGVKAADEDTELLNKEMQSRRENYLTEVCENIVDWVDAHTTDLKKPAEVTIEWSDLTAPTMQQKMDIADKMSVVTKNMVASAQPAPYSSNDVRETTGHEILDELDEMLMPDDEGENIDDPAGA